jgi:hypothetical protein
MAGWNYTVIERGTKLGIHAIRGDKVTTFVQRALDAGARLPVVKAVDEFGTLHVVREMSPETIIVGRVHYGGEALSEAQFERDPKEVAEEYMQHTTAKVQLHGDDVDYWEPTNETLPPGPGGYARFAEIHKHMMDIAEREGYKIALFTCNAGTPEWDEMVAMVETGVFGRAKEGGHILCLHEGVFGMDPVEKWWGDLIPGSPAVPGAGALCFRYRYLYSLLEERDEVIPLVVSEIVFGGGYSQDGTPPAEVVRRARWYDERAREDYYVWAFLPFTLGPPRGWTHQDYEFAYPALVDYAIEIKDEANALAPDAPPPPPPPPSPPESPCRGLPREQYERTYVLLPPGASAAWARAVAESTWDEKRYTIGGSADDAGVGDLDARRVIAVNPQNWPGVLALEDFFAQYYPGVEYSSITAATPEELSRKLADV